MTSCGGVGPSAPGVHGGSEPPAEALTSARCRCFRAIRFAETVPGGQDCSRSGWPLPLQVFSTLVHELCHAATDGHGHDKVFTRCARALWLEGKPSSAAGGERFKINFKDLLDSLGAYPHSRLNIEAVRKKQTTRMLKAACPHCGYTVRLTQKWADLGLPECPVDGETLVLS